jgi:hypothetical protein
MVLRIVGKRFSRVADVTKRFRRSRPSLMVIMIIASTYLTTWIMLAPLPPASVYGYGIIERFHRGEKVNGQILCLELPACHVKLKGVDLLLWDLDAGELPQIQQMQIEHQCVLSYQWGCDAQFSIGVTGGDTLRLKSVQLDQASTTTE